MLIAVSATIKITGNKERQNGATGARIIAAWIFCGFWMATLGGIAINTWMELDNTRGLCQSIAPILSRTKFDTPPLLKSLDHLDGPYLIYYCPHGKPKSEPHRLDEVDLIGSPPQTDGLPLGLDDHWKNFANGEDTSPPGRANDSRDPIGSAKYLVIVSRFVEHSSSENVTVQEHIITHVPGVLGGSTYDETHGPPRDEVATTNFISLKADIFDIRSGKHIYSKVIGPSPWGEKLIPKLYDWLSSLYTR